MRREGETRGESRGKENKGEEKRRRGGVQTRGEEAEKMERKASNRGLRWAETWEEEEMRRERKQRESYREGGSGRERWKKERAISTLINTHLNEVGTSPATSVFTNRPVIPPCYLDPGGSVQSNIITRHTATPQRTHLFSHSHVISDF